MKYIKDLEAAGFGRNQAEAQVQMVLDVLEGDLVTKSDFAIFQERLFVQIDKKFDQFEDRFEKKFEQIDGRFDQIESRFEQVENKFDHKLLALELRLITRLGFLTMSTVSIAVATLTWLIKN